jgi:glycosyltransferase involved in cell wall biosynthesis
MLDTMAKTAENPHPAGKIYLSLVVPCFNEDESVPLFHNEAVKICVLLNEQFELIYIDDGSNDNTLDVLRQLANQDNRVHYISFSRNFGKEAALLAGLQAARGDYIATMDADGQDPPSFIPDMLQAVASGEYDCAGTRRVNRKGEPLVRSFFSSFFYKLLKKIANIEIASGTRDFRLMNRKYLDAFLLLTERGRFSKGIFPWIGFNIKWFEYINLERIKGKSKWTFWKLFLYSLDGVSAFSEKPLVIASVLGGLFFIAAFSFMIFLLVRKLFWGNPASGLAITVCVILFCSGIQLFTTGILGQYAAKIYAEVKHRPHYIVREAR